MRSVRLLIDPGHTGVSDPGVVAAGVREADIVLDVALAMQGKLRGVAGLEVRLTREGSKDLAQPYTQKSDLQARVDMANAWPADFFLSLHVNAAREPRARGLETYTHPLASSEARRLAAVIHHYALPLVTPDRGLKQADFYVLRQTKMPSCLVELGFITNEAERALLSDPSFRLRVAESLARGVVAAFDLSPAPFPEKVPGLGTPILGPASVEEGVAHSYLRSLAPGWEDIAAHTWRIAPLYNVRPEVALSLMLHETGLFRFGGDVSPEQNNFGGLGAIGEGWKGASFGSRAEGVEAVIQHLFAYASSNPIPAGRTLVDPRFAFVKRGSAKTLEELAGKWAVPGYDTNRFRSFEEAYAAGQTYGQVIRDRYLLPLLAAGAGRPLQPAPVPPVPGSPKPSPPTPPAPLLPPRPEPQPVWDPAAEVRRLRERGVINSDHDPAASPTWGELAAVVNRILDRLSPV